MSNDVNLLPEIEELTTKTTEFITKIREQQQLIDILYEEQQRELYEAPQPVSIRFCKNDPKEMYFQNAQSNNFTLGISDTSSWTFNPVDKDASKITSYDMRDCKDNCETYPFLKHFFD